MNGMKGPLNSPLGSSPTRSLFVFTEKSGLSPVLTLDFRVCRYTTDIMVFCFVLGEVPAIENHFVVDITDKIKNISHLQNAIKEVKKPQLNDFALNDLKLWKVYISINKNEAKLSILDKQPQEVDIERDLEGQKLIPSDDVPKDFCQQQPPLKIIHIIVQLSQPTTTGKCLPMVYLLNKKFMLSHIIIFFIRLGKR